MPSTNGHGPKRAILYTRVSTDEQARSGYSLAQQLEALRKYATREGYEVLEEIRDPGQSGASLERPGMDRVRDLVAAGGVSVVLAQDRDRFTREPAYHYILREELKEYGTKIRALNDRGDETPEGDLTDGILDQLGKYERAKMTERTRRGKLKKAREGKVVATNRPHYGFSYNDTRDNYLVIKEEMRVVGRIFQMMGEEGATLHRVRRTLEREGVPSPNGKNLWGTFFIRECIKDDVYKAHTYQEIEALVDRGQMSQEVAARLDPEKHYGIWWFNRYRTTTAQVADQNADGSKRYRKRRTYAPKPESEWIAVAVPDAGIPRSWVDSARESIAKNKSPSKNGGRFWELSGGITRCADCGRSMQTSTVTSGNSPKVNFYYRCAKHHRNEGPCSNRRSHRADRLEPLVWGYISGVMKDPEQLRADLDAMIELERKSVRGNPDREAKMWLDKLAEADRMRRGYQEQAAKGYMTLDELGAALGELDETRKTAERELADLESRREHIAQMERDRDAVLEHYAKIAPEALDSLAPEERHTFYKMLRLTVVVRPDGTPEVSWAGAPAGDGVCESETLSPSPSWRSSSPLPSSSFSPS
jgi:site-specific DNA recombinase